MVSSVVTRLAGHAGTLCTPACGRGALRKMAMGKLSERRTRTHEVGHSGTGGAGRVAEMDLERAGPLVTPVAPWSVQWSPASGGRVEDNFVPPHLRTRRSRFKG